MEQRKKNSYDSDTYTFWKNQIKAAEAYRKRFIDEGESIMKRFRNDDIDIVDDPYPILYSNTETLLPVVYSNPPKAEARAKDMGDVASRLTAEMIEDTLNYFINTKDFDSIARKAVYDFLLPGLGQIRPLYASDIGTEEIILDDGETQEEKVLFERIDFQHIHWKDYIYPPCACWDDVNWFAIRSYVTYDQIVEDWGREKADYLSYAPLDENNINKQPQNQDNTTLKAVIYEIWDKDFKERIFFAEGRNSVVLEIQDDPLQLSCFFPMVKPLEAITTSGDILPVPFFRMYKAQADMLDEINYRLYRMIENLRRRGFYDSTIDELGEISNMGDNTFWPVKNWDLLTGKGGLNGVMQTEDLEPYIKVINVLLEAKMQILNDIYQIIGLSDIRRAQTDPRETLGAQKLKSRYGTIRISTYQNKVQEYFRDLIKLTADLIVNNFSPETIALITGRPIETTKDREGNIKEVGVVDLLKNLKDKYPTDITIDIATDSTLLEDIEEDRAATAEAINSLVQFTTVSEQLTQSIGLEATAQLLLAIVEKYKLGRDIQQDVLNHINSLQDKENTPQEPSIEQQKLQLEIQKMTLKAQETAANIRLKQQENLLRAQEQGMEAEIQKEKVNLEALDRIIDVMKLNVEAESPNVNKIVGF